MVTNDESLTKYPLFLRTLSEGGVPYCKADTCRFERECRNVSENDIYLSTSSVLRAVVIVSTEWEFFLLLKRIL
ncbi:uncharacterized protein L203_103674 [Cryptococcus depauperatus CBS 7841]|uniref:Uncharacterized protein n=1 Tax=Cryptococcus depauperatus CBS 7841 TaxID=1295531 RepID=A0AAJ8JU38_9TREE